MKRLNKSLKKDILSVYTFSNFIKYIFFRFKNTVNSFLSILNKFLFFLFRKIFNERQIYLRTDGRVSYFKIPIYLQLLIIILIILISYWLIFTSSKYIYNEKIISQKNNTILEMRTAYKNLSNELNLSKKHYIDTTYDLKSKHNQLIKIIKQKNDLEIKLDEMSSKINKSFNKNKINNKLYSLRKKLNDERLFISKNMDVFKFNNLNFSSEVKFFSFSQSDYKSLTIKNLNDEVVSLENEIFNLKNQQQSLITDVTEKTIYEIASISNLISKTGLKVEKLLKNTYGSGGPLIPLDWELEDHGGLIEGHEKEFHKTITILRDRLERWEILQNLLKSVPISSPLQNYYISSHYGKRTDPFTKKLAFHGGADLAGPYGQSIFAPAAGKVRLVRKGGPYGRLIEIDHGYGIRTRYGHLSKILVKKNEEVDYRKIIGKVGSSGRSTGSHLHYEVWFGRNLLNPNNFLKAGEYVFKN